MGTGWRGDLDLKMDRQKGCPWGIPCPPSCQPLLVTPARATTPGKDGWAKKRNRVRDSLARAHTVPHSSRGSQRLRRVSSTSHRALRTLLLGLGPRVRGSSSLASFEVQAAVWTLVLPTPVRVWISG